MFTVLVHDQYNIHCILNVTCISINAASKSLKLVIRKLHVVVYHRDWLLLATHTWLLSPHLLLAKCMHFSLRKCVQLSWHRLCVTALQQCTLLPPARQQWVVAFAWGERVLVSYWCKRLTDMISSNNVAKTVLHFAPSTGANNLHKTTPTLIVTWLVCMYMKLLVVAFNP